MHNLCLSLIPLLNLNFTNVNIVSKLCGFAGTIFLVLSKPNYLTHKYYFLYILRQGVITKEFSRHSFFDSVSGFILDQVCLSYSLLCPWNQSASYSPSPWRVPGWQEILWTMSPGTQPRARIVVVVPFHPECRFFNTYSV